MFRINQSSAICSEFEAKLCKFMVIPLATLQRGVSIREELRGEGGKERIGEPRRKGGTERDSVSWREQGKSKRRDRERETEDEE